LSDVENDVACTPQTVMRIASISKPLTMTVVARLWQEGKLDIDKSIQEYVPTWPEKSWDGKKVSAVFFTHLFRFYLFYLGKYIFVRNCIDLV